MKSLLKKSIEAPKGVACRTTFKIQVPNIQRDSKFQMLKNTKNRITLTPSPGCGRGAVRGPAHHRAAEMAIRS